MKCTNSAVISVLILLILFSSRRVSSTVNYKTWSVTEFEELVLKHTWTIHDCESITLLNQTVPIDSSKFSPPGNNNFTWYLRLYLEYYENYTRLLLYHDNADTVEVNYTLSIGSVKYEDRKTFEGFDYWGAFSYFKRDEVFKSCQPNGPLNINCEIRAIHKMAESSSSNSNQFSLIKNQAINAKPSDNFSKAAQFNDVTIIVGRNVIRADKKILAERSPVFASLLLKNGTLNNYGNSSIIKINDVEPKVFRLLLHYIYTNKVDDIDGAMAEQLSVAAIKYGLKDLKVICDNILRDKKSQANTKLLAKRVPLAIQSTANVVPT